MFSRWEDQLASQRKGRVVPIGATPERALRLLPKEGVRNSAQESQRTMRCQDRLSSRGQRRRRSKRSEWSGGRRGKSGERAYATHRCRKGDLPPGFPLPLAPLPLPGAAGAAAASDVSTASASSEAEAAAAAEATAAGGFHLERAALRTASMLTGIKCGPTPGGKR